MTARTSLDLGGRVPGTGISSRLHAYVETTVDGSRLEAASSSLAYSTAVVEFYSLEPSLAPSLGLE